MNQENTLATPWTEEVLPEESQQLASIPYAGFFRRAIAFLLDVLFSAIIPALICFPIILFLGNKAALSEQMGQDPSGYSLAILSTYLAWNILGAISFWLYFALQEGGKHQATFGKRLMKIKVINEKGFSIGFAHATGRTFSKTLSYFIFTLGFLMAPFSNRKKALHDYIAQTHVVKASFQTGDPLPDTPNRLGIFFTIVAVLAFVFAIFSLTVLSKMANPTLLKSQIARSVLPVLAQDPEPLTEPIIQNEVTFFQDEAGYWALFQDEAAEAYVLHLPKPDGEVCCEIYPGENCQNISVPVCE